MKFGLDSFKVVVQMGQKSKDDGSLPFSGSNQAVREGIKGYLDNVSNRVSPNFELNEKIIQKLPKEFKEQAEQYRHLGAYVSELPIDEIGIPEFKSFVNKAADSQDKRNLLYPVGGGVFIHVIHS